MNGRDKLPRFKIYEKIKMLDKYMWIWVHARRLSHNSSLRLFYPYMKQQYKCSVYIYELDNFGIT